ncbi:MAG: aminoacyl-tRNA hydrolase [Coraliomargaritaceae bacterium]
MSIAVIAGLGNPGPKYRNTRHNIGFDVVDALAIRASTGSSLVWKQDSRFEAVVAEVVFSERKLLLMKPQTFMNASGRSISAVMRYRKLQPQEVLVLYDDITLDLARIKLSCGGSAGGHNGIADIIQRIGSGFTRYRVGVGAKPEKEMDLADYVLSQFSADERKLLDSRMPDYLEQIALVVDKGIEPAMNIINQRSSS